MPLNPKTLQTIINRYGSYEQYKDWRYSPEKMKHIPEAAKKGSEASVKSDKAYRPFKDKKVASEAGKKRWDANK